MYDVLEYFSCFQAQFSSGLVWESDLMAPHDLAPVMAPVTSSAAPPPSLMSNIHVVDVGQVMYLPAAHGSNAPMWCHQVAFPSCKEAQLRFELEMSAF